MAPPASSPFHPHATGDRGTRLPFGASGTATASGAPTTTTFTTQAPRLVAEKAHATALYQVYEDLCSRVAIWSSRLAHERTVEGSKASSPVMSVEPSAPIGHRRATSCSINTGTAASSDFRWSTARQTAGEVPVDAVGTVLRHPSPNAEAYAEEDTELLVSANPATRASSSVPQSATSTTSLTALGGSSNSSATTETCREAAACHRGAESVRLHPVTRPTPPRPVLLPTATSSPPPWLASELAAFFDERLALAIQTRETQLVNIMHACAQQELQCQAQRVQTLEQAQREFDKWKDHWQSKLDRRVAETDALRKEYYKQLLMLRDLVAKQRSDPRTLRALEDVITTVMHGTTSASDRGSSAGTASNKSAWLYPHGKRADAGTGARAADVDGAVAGGTTNSAAMRREKEKWEERAREAAAECQQLQEQVLVLKQQLEEARGMDGELWFATAQHGLYERQRVIDCVYKAKCSWDQVGDAVLELLNNEMVWQAVEESAYREKSRVSRGLEALLQRVESLGGGGVTDPQDAGKPGDEADDEQAKRVSARRRGSAFLEGSRVIMCRTCNGCGYLDAAAATGSNQTGAAEQEDDSYLRKTLAQVLELKTALDEANSRTNQVEQQLLRTVMEGAHIKETLEKIQLTRAHSVDSCLQTDLDEEEEIDVEAIMNAYSDPAGDPVNDGQRGPGRRGGRWKQYEHLIVELKSLLSERDAAIAQLRNSVADAQARLASLQKTSQQEQERLQRDLQALKGSLALAMTSRNEVIEEKQAAVNMLIKNIDRKKSQALSSKSFLLPPRASKLDVNGDDGAASVDSNNDSVDTYDECVDEEDDIDEADEVKRSELIARRYSQAVGRVQQEHEEQQQRLKEAEDELGQDSDKRKRTNSIMLGNIAVTMTSHPRDLFKALSTTHQELLTFRRSSQRSSALQTDRLLTLTTHLAHISEELVMVKKRTSAEIEFWRLDCEKLQNANKALAADYEKAQKLIEEANERAAQAIGRKSISVCGVCEKHEARLLALSVQLLQELPPGGASDASPNRRASGLSTTNDDAAMSEAERQGLSAILLDLENMYSTLSSSKQEHAKQAITRALLGGAGPSGSYADSAFASRHAHSPMSLRRTTSGSSVVPETAEGTLFMGQSNTPRRSTQLAGSSPSARLFEDPFFASSVQAPRQSPTSLFAVHGSSLPTARPTGDNVQTHHRKTIVRKVLSEQEALQRQRARSSRREYYSHESLYVDSQGSQLLEAQDDDAILNPDSAEADQVDGGAEPAYSTYVDEDGNQVFYVDIEEDEDIEEPIPGNGEASTMGDMEYPSHSDQSQMAHALQLQRRVDLSIQIPSPDHAPSVLIMSRRPNEQQLLTASNEIEKDPEVIAKLRELVNEHSRSREALALTNWRILVSHFRAARDQRRLDFVNDSWRTGLAAGTVRASASPVPPTLPQAVRTTMQKIVQWREFALDDAIRERDELRKESRRAQAHRVDSTDDFESENQSKDPCVRCTATRSHRPAEKSEPNILLTVSTSLPVGSHQSEIPKTQQVPTPSFPLAVEPSALKEQSIYPPKRTSPTGTALNTRNMSDGRVAEISYGPSIFENDNRFPQRAVKFVPAGDGDELSLTHSTSTFRVATSSFSPIKSPMRAGLTVDTRRRPTHSAGPVLNSPSMTATLEASLYPMFSADAPIRDTLVRRPVRPQSSPANALARFRPTSATVVHADDGLASEEVRLP